MITKQYCDKLLQILGAISLLGLCVNAIALPVTVSDYQKQTVDGQTFNFNLVAPDSAATSSKLTISVQADLDQAFENIASVIVEGDNLGSFSRLSPEAYGIQNPGGENFNTYRLSLDFLFDIATTTQYLTDGILALSIEFSPEVTELFGWGSQFNGERIGTSPFALARFTYNNAELESEPVPAPATLALLGLGLAALSWSRRKKA